MPDDFNNLPRFPGDLSDHLPAQPREPDSLADRIRHAWVWYLTLAVSIPLWITAVVLTVVNRGTPIAILLFPFVVLPLGLYFRVVMLRMVTGRDAETGERIASRDR